MAKKTNMYSLNIKTWSPFVGCRFGCIYCKRSFQAQAKRQKHRCTKCYNYEPHEHPERLTQRLPKTGYGQFIFTCASGDISFCSTEYLNKIVDRIRNEPNKTFLIQSKNPATFERIEWPDNVILGTTMESNQNTILFDYSKITTAPSLWNRYKDFINIKHPWKMITIEPVLDFDLEVMIARIEKINPLIIWLGYDTKKTGLPEPPIEKVKELHWQLSKLGFPVMLKKIR